MSKTKPVDGEKVQKGLRRLSEYITTSVRHFWESTKNVMPKNIDNYVNKSKDAAKKIWKKESRGILDHNFDVSQATQHAKKLMEGNVAGQKLLKLSQHKWFRRSIIGVGALVGATMLEKGLNSFNPQPLIPKNYERGYDVMNETMTDFGSPVKLARTASKIITPYYSSIRKGVVTTTRSVTNRNLSLALSNKAIGHTRY